MITPCNLLFFDDGDQRTTHARHQLGHLDDGVVGVDHRYILTLLGQHVANRLATQLRCGLVGHRFGEHAGQPWVFLHIAGHDESDDLGCREDRVRCFGRVGDNHQSVQPVLGKQADRVQRGGVDVDDRELLDDLLGAHAAHNKFL